MRHYFRVISLNKKINGKIIASFYLENILKALISVITIWTAMKFSFATLRVACDLIIGVPLRHGEDKLGLEKGTTRFGKGVT